MAASRALERRGEDMIKFAAQAIGFAHRVQGSQVTVSWKSCVLVSDTQHPFPAECHLR